MERIHSEGSFTRARIVAHVMILLKILRDYDTMLCNLLALLIIANNSTEAAIKFLWPIIYTYYTRFLIDIIFRTKKLIKFL